MRVATRSTAHRSANTDVHVRMLGLFAPTEPFPSTASRVELASRLAEDLGKSAGFTGSGKYFARASDFAAAVKRGEVTIALVDGAYLAAAGGNFTVIAFAQRDGEANHGWQLVARDVDTIAALKGKRVLVPAIGGREGDFFLNVLLGSEVGRDFFGKIEPAPDTASALAAVGLGKADAAVVPTGAQVPSTMSVVLALPAVPGAVLVAYGPVDQAKLAAAAASFRGDATISGFRAGDAEAIRVVGRRFAPTIKRGPLAVPAVRLLVGDLVEGRAFTIERTPPMVFALSPDRR